MIIVYRDGCTLNKKDEYLLSVTAGDSYVEEALSISHSL